MRTILTLALLVCSTLAATAQDDPPALSEPVAPPAPAATADIRGTVLTRDGEPVALACVVIADAASGVPFVTDGWVTLGKAAGAGDANGALSRLVFATTDADGVFVFEDVPPGSYRFVAQKWTEETEATDPLDEHTARVELFGTAEDVSVADADLDGLELSPPGEGVLTVRCESANNETLLVLSTAATRADPVLALAGWTGPFMQNAVGFNRMPLGETTFVGVPAGTVHVAIFSTDNNPGFGAASVEMRPERRAIVEVPWVASWSNGMQSAPPRLAPVIERLTAAGVTDRAAFAALLDAHGVDAPPPTSITEALVAAAALLDERVPLPDGGEPVPGGDLAAAFGYMNMGRALKSRGREPNPWHEPKIEHVPLDAEPGEAVDEPPVGDGAGDDGGG